MQSNEWEPGEERPDERPMMVAYPPNWRCGQMLADYNWVCWRTP